MYSPKVLFAILIWVAMSSQGTPTRDGLRQANERAVELGTAGLMSRDPTDGDQAVPGSSRIRYCKTCKVP